MYTYLLERTSAWSDSAFSQYSINIKTQYQDVWLNLFSQLTFLFTIADATHCSVPSNFYFEHGILDKSTFDNTCT